MKFYEIPSSPITESCRQILFQVAIAVLGQCSSTVPLHPNSFEMAKKFTYKTQGTCSKSIEIELEGDIVKSVRFEGGCHGNTQGIGLLTRGMQAADVIARLEGIDCKGRGTSCPDQLAKALRQALGQ